MFKELWFLENPIETKIGVCRFIKVREYEKILISSSILQNEKKETINYIKENNKNAEGIDKVVEELNNMPFIQIIKEVKWLGLYDGYTNLFNLCFQEKGSFDLIQTDEELDFYVKLIKDMNYIAFEKINPNPELAYYDKLSRIMKEKKGEIITFKAMVTSVGLFRQDVLEIAIYSLYEYFSRIGSFKNYDTTALFKSVGSEQKIENWFKDDSIEKTKLDEDDYKYINKQVAEVKDSPEKRGTILNKL